MSIAAQEKGGCLDEFTLFAEVDGQGGRSETIGFSVSDFDEHKAIAILHDEIYFADAAAKISCDQA